MELTDEDLLWWSLFSNFHETPPTPAGELVRIVEWGRRLLEGDSCDDDIDNLVTSISYGHWQIADAIRADELPAEALEALAGLTALVGPRADEFQEYAGNAVWSLAEPTVKPTSIVTGLVHSQHATYPPFADRWGDFESRPTDTEDGERAFSPASALVDRTVPLSIGGVTFEKVAAHRPIAFHNRHVSIVWEALCAAFDVLAGSQLAIDQLAEIAERAPEAPAVLWLAESALRLAGAGARAQRVAERLDALLASGRYGKNALALTALADRREELASEAAAVGDTLLKIGANQREGDESPVAEEVSAGAGSDLSEALVEEALEYMTEAEQLAADWERVSEGPFHGLTVAAEQQKVLAPAIEEMLVGFRCVAGLERLCAAMPALLAWRAQTAS